jgi:capsular polysaccharide biosynthesis protein
LTRRKEIGEDIFEKLFKKNGYKILAPETLTFEEQAYLIYNCKTLASIEGTLAHNIVFAKKETQQIILRKQSEVIPRQIMLNQVTSTDVIYIDVYKEPFKSFPISHDRGPFLLVWNINIERFIADNKFESISVNVIKQIYNLCIYGMKCLIYSCKHKMKRFWLNKSHVINAYI